MTQKGQSPVVEEAIDFVESWRRLQELMEQDSLRGISKDEDSELHSLVEFFDYAPPVRDPQSDGPEEVRQALSQVQRLYLAYNNAAFGRLENSDESWPMQEQAFESFQFAIRSLANTLRPFGYLKEWPDDDLR